MHLKTSRPSKLIRFDSGVYAAAVTQDDMPPSTWTPGFRDDLHKDRGAVYRVYSEDRLRSAFFEYVFAMGNARCRELAPTHVFKEVGARRDVGLRLDPSQLAELIEQRRIETVVGSYRSRPSDPWAMSGFPSASKLAFDSVGTPATDQHGHTPSVLLWSEVSVPHLNDREVEMTIAGKEVGCSITFSSHCWTVKASPETHASLPVIVDENGAPRMMSSERYELSFDLPEMIERLRNFRVFKTKQYGNFGVFSANDVGADAYTAFFSVVRQPDDDFEQKFNIQVRSAYVARRPRQDDLVPLPKLFRGTRRSIWDGSDDAKEHLYWGGGE